MGEAEDCEKLALSFLRLMRFGGNNRPVMPLAVFFLDTLGEKSNKALFFGSRLAANPHSLYA